MHCLINQHVKTTYLLIYKMSEIYLRTLLAIRKQTTNFAPELRGTVLRKANI